MGIRKAKACVPIMRSASGGESTRVAMSEQTANATEEAPCTVVWRARLGSCTQLPAQRALARPLRSASEVERSARSTAQARGSSTPPRDRQNACGRSRVAWLGSY